MVDKILNAILIKKKKRFIEGS